MRFPPAFSFFFSVFGQRGRQSSPIPSCVKKKRLCDDAPQSPWVSKKYFCHPAIKNLRKQFFDRSITFPVKMAFRA